jgi:hypothetical protein
MNFYKIFALGLAITFLFSGCGGNNSDVSSSTNSGIPNVVDTNNTISANSTISVVLPISSTVLTTNSQVVSIKVRAFDNLNNPYSTGNIQLINSKEAQVRDVGTFDIYKAPLVNGVATFTYTGPANLKKDTSNIYFGFYYDSNASNVKTYTMSIVPEVNQTILTSYEIKSVNENNVTMGLNETKTIGYEVYDKTGNKVPDKDITSFIVTSLNSSLILLSSSTTTQQPSIESTNNNITVNVSSNTLSGLVPIKVEAKFLDANGKEKSLTKVYSIVVHSGPINAISLAYAGTSNDTANAKFIENWVLTATDKYNNLVNTHPSIASGMLAGYATSSGTQTNPLNQSTKYLYSIPNTPLGGGTINGSTGVFTANDSVFANVDFVHDYLVTFGNGYTYGVSGKWDITQNNNTTVNLVDNYEGSNISGLGFAVGNNYRQDRCLFGEEWIGNVYPKNNDYILGTDGSKVLQISYDYYLVGKDVVLWANLTGSTQGKIKRIGEARKVTLRGLGLTGETYDFNKGYIGIAKLKIDIKDTIEPYKNARFDYTVKVSGNDVNWSVSSDSMDNGIASCVNGGVAYVDVNITGAANAGTVSFSRLIIKNEF